jgi:hypothetical protein
MIEVFFTLATLQLNPARQYQKLCAVKEVLITTKNLASNNTGFNNRFVWLNTVM